MAFPTTPILDDFSGTLGNWTTPSFGDQALTITAGEVTSSSATLYGTGVWTASFAEDQEVYYTIPSAAGHAILIARCTDNVNLTSYVVAWVPSGGYDISRWNVGVETVLKSGSSAYASGDKIGASVIGSTITIYKDTGAGFVFVDSTVDGSPISGSSQIGASFENNSVTGDDFGGGAVVSGTGLAWIRA